jgi:hypothetical protein
MRADRAAALELAAIGAAAIVFVATFQVRPPYLDFVLAAAAVALIVVSAARSRRFWALARSVDPTGARGAWKATLVFTAVALIVLAAAALLTARAAEAPVAERFGNWHILLAAALYFPWALLQQYHPRRVGMQRRRQRAIERNIERPAMTDHHGRATIVDVLRQPPRRGPGRQAISCPQNA